MKVQYARELHARGGLVHVSVPYMGSKTPYTACSYDTHITWAQRRRAPGPLTCLKCLALALDGQWVGL